MQHKTLVKALSILLLPVLVAGLLLVWVPMAQAAGDRYVSTTGADSGDCSVNACATIQYAINQAVDGDTIHVADGAYNESFTINKSVTLKSDNGRDVTTINLQSGPTYVGAIHITGAVVTIDGFTINGFDAVGPGLASTNVSVAYPANNVILKNNRFKVGQIGTGSNGDDGFGLVTYYDTVNFISSLTVTDNDFLPLNADGRRAFYINPGVDQFTFSDNAITGKFTARAGTQAKNSLIEDNVITGTGAAGSRSAGMFTWGYPDPSIYGKATFRGNTFTGVATGIDIFSANDVVVEENTFTQVGVGVSVTEYYGIFDPTTIDIHDNTFLSADTYAITNSTMPLVDATLNYFGTADCAAVSALISGNVSFIPYYADGALTVLASAPVTNVTQTTYFCAIQPAIDAADPGDTIDIGPGTYNENVTVSKKLVLDGAGSGTNPAVDTIIQATAANADVIRVTAGGTAANDRLVIQDVRVVNALGGSTLHAGVKLDASGANPLSYITLDNVAAVGNTGNAAGVLLHGTTVDTDIITDVKIVNSTLSNNRFGLYTKGAQVHGLAVTGEGVGRSKVEDNAHSGILAEGTGALATQYQDFEISHTDLSRNNPGGDPDAGHGEMFLLSFNGDLTVEDVVVTSGGTSGSTWYIAIGVNGKYTGGAAPAGAMLFKDITFNDTPGATVFPRASLGIWTYSNLDAGVTVDGVQFNATGKTRGSLYPFSLAGSTPLAVKNSTFAGNSRYVALPVDRVTDIALVSSTAPVNAVDNVTFTGAADDFAVEDRIIHKIDNVALGLVTWVTDNVFVTPDSYLPAATTVASINRGVNAVAVGGTVNVADGIYVEQVVIDGKNLTLKGQSLGTIIQAPNSVPTCFSTDNKPIVCVKNAIATIDTFTVDGAGEGNANNRFIGVAFRNAGGELKNSAVIDIRDTPFSGAQHGVAIYAYNDDSAARSLAILDNEISGFQKNGMAIITDGSSQLVVDIDGNDVQGYGETTVTAQNGIQVYQSGGSLMGTITDNTVNGIAYDNTLNLTKWVATSILNFYAPVDIVGNTVTNGHMGIYNIDASGNLTDNNLTIVKVGVSAFGIIATDPPEAVPSPYDDDVVVASGAPRSAMATLNVNVSDNTVTFSGGDNTSTYGIEADGGYGPDNIAFTANGNTVSGFEVGIEIWQCQSDCDTGVFTSVVANNNCLAGNDYGMRSNVTYLTVDGRYNWWGHASGPYNAGANPGGTGAAVSDNIDFYPWIVDGCNGTALSTTTLSATTNDALFCTGETTEVFIDLAYAWQLYGYQFEVSYDPAYASASGAFVNSFFNTTVNAQVPPLWSAVCAGNTCRFAAAKQAPATPLSGSGQLAKITLTGVAPGTFNMTFSDDLLSDIDGAPLAHTLGADLPITVCGLANISGFITLQGRFSGNVNTGTVSMQEQTTTNFGSFGPATFSASDGAYSIQVPYMPGGSSYQIVAEHGLYLDNEKTFTVSGDLANQNTRLWGGDADNNSNVKIADLSCIGGAFGETPVTTVCGSTGSPDINADNRVNIQDLSIAGGNFDKCGAQPWTWQTGTPVLCQ